MAGGAKADLPSGEEKLSTAQAGTGLACDASWHRDRSHSRLTGIRPLWTVEYRLYRAGESDRPTWNSRTDTPHVGHRTAVSPPAGPSGVVASLLPFCTSPCLATSGARAATRARWQSSGTTLPATDASHGSGKNEPTMDSHRGALLPLAASFRLRATQARCGCSVMAWSGG